TSTCGAGMSETVVAGAPSMTTLVNTNHGVTPGKMEQTDTTTVTFSQPMKVSTFCSAWTNDNADQTDNTATVHVTGNGTSSNNILSISAWANCPTFHFGSMDMGTKTYVTSTGTSNKPEDFTGSTIAY